MGMSMMIWGHVGTQIIGHLLKIEEGTSKFNFLDQKFSFFRVELDET